MAAAEPSAPSVSNARSCWWGHRSAPNPHGFAALLLTLALYLFANSPVRAHDDSIIRLIEATRPSIVGIGTTQPTRVPVNELKGTGFVVGDGSLVVTNAHVVRDTVDTTTGERYVVFSGRGDSAKGIACKILARDETHDLALIKLSGDIRLPALDIGNSNAVREGQQVVFTGFPIGAVLGLFPVTHQGMVSAITPIATPAGSARELSAARVRRLSDPFPVFQLDATAYPGNSGSPVFDIDSNKVIAVINQVYVKGSRENVLKDPSDIAYAIPARHVLELLERGR